jgi:predicted amidophosphoribosyltransferase
VFGPLLDALFPKRCAGCGEGPWPFCDRCRAEIVVLRPPWCGRCSAPAPRAVETCRHCPPEPLVAARSPFLFEGPVRRAVHRLKFAGWRPVAEALGAAMARSCDLSVDAITWVPLSRRRKAARGFDQALALARAVAPRLDLPLVPLLRRVADAGPQARRGGDERRQAMLDAFAGIAPAPARVLLVDDVLTTGATAAACASALVAAGASEVSVLTAARAVSGAVTHLYSTPGLRSGLWLPGESLSGSRSQPRAKRPT